MARTTINTQVIPDGTIVSADLSYPLTDFSSTGIDDNASSTSLTIDSSGNISVTGTVDGRDLATDGTKLDGIEASADVTDTANVTAAGALMDSEVTNLAQVKAFSSSDYATAAQGTTADSALQNIVEDTTPQLGGDLASNGSDILFADNDKAIFGAGSDLQIYHSGSNSHITDAGTGDLLIRGANIEIQTGGGNRYFTGQSNVARLYHLDVERLRTSATGIDVTGTVVADGLESSGGLDFTAVDGITISAKESAIIRIDSDDNDSSRVFQVLSGTTGSSETLINASEDAGVTLYYDNASKLATTSTGINVTGTVTSDGLTVDGVAEISSTTPTLRFFETDQTDEGTLLRSAGDSFQIAKMLDTGVADGVRFAIDQSSGDISFYEDTGTTQAFFWDASTERLGIGTTSPGEKLDVNGTIQVISSGNQGLAAQIYTDSAGNMNLLADHGNNGGGDHIFRNGSAGTELVRILNTGNVGIGTTSPSYLLSLEGSNAAVAFTDSSRLSRIYTRNGGRDLEILGNQDVIINGSGGTNVGIGTTSPTDDLHVFKGGNSTLRVESSGTTTQSSVWTENDVGRIHGVFVYGSSHSSYGAINSGEGAFYSNGPVNIMADNPSGNIKFSTGGSGGSERMRISSGGNVGIGITNPSEKLHVSGNIRAGVSATAFQNGSANDNYIGVGSDNGGDAWFIAHASGYGVAFMGYENAGDRLLIGCDNGAGNNKIDFSVNMGTTSTGTVENTSSATPAMRIDSSGNVLVGKTSASIANTGVEIRQTAAPISTFNGVCLYLNRQTTDGTLIEFRQNNATEGTISVSGTTVSYNGGHLSRWSQSDIDDVSTIYKGTVMSNLDEMCVWTNEDNEQLNKTKISDVEGDVNVAGVFVAEDNSDDLSDYYLAMTGDMIIRIAQGTTVQRGALLMSAGDGTAKPQDDDIVRSKTIAKVTSTNVTCTYADGSYCVPCVLIAC